MRRAVGAVGRILVTLGVLILLFVGYQLWGTGLYTAREQSRLKDQFAQELQRASSSTTDPGPTTTTTPPPPPPSGEAVAVLRIPRIGVDSAVVQGVEVEDLRKGPGHYPETPLPGQLGNAAIAGHRTTYGQPFNRLDELSPGDQIEVTTLQGSYRYVVDPQTDADGNVSGHVVVQPNQVEVLQPTPNPTLPGTDFATLTLTTCNPKFSAAERLVVKATWKPATDASPEPAEPSTRTVAASTLGLSGERSSIVPLIWWGLVVAVVGFLWWWLFHRYRRWTTWVVGVIPFLVVLFFFYANLERVLPSNY
ncbi:MAG: class E sortase [Acidimicrobiia bacterium]